jgi:ethanolamine permease
LVTYIFIASGTALFVQEPLSRQSELPCPPMSTLGRTPIYYASKFHLLALVLVNALTGIYNSWNTSLSHGLGYELVSIGILGFAFIIYNCCSSELSSTFPFPGGSYGLARCTLGFFAGYIVGCCEIFYYVLSFCYNNVAMVYILAEYYPSLSSYSFLLLLLIILLQVGICGVSRRLLWSSIAVMALFTMGLNFSYIFGSFGYVDFDRYAYSAQDDRRKVLFVGSGVSIFQNISPLIWCFLGPEYVNLTCDDVVAPRREIPFAQVTGIVIIVLHNIAIALVSCSMSPGADGVSDLVIPLGPGTVPDSSMRV